MPAARIWTIGHSTRTAEAFIGLLRTHQIDRLADIRTIPQSRRYPHFGRDGVAIACCCPMRRVDVQHILSEAKTQPHRLTPFAKIREDNPRNQTSRAGV